MNEYHLTFNDLDDMRLWMFNEKFCSVEMIKIILKNPYHKYKNAASCNLSHSKFLY